MTSALKFFSMEKMTYGPDGEEQPLYAIKSDYFAQLESYAVNKVSFGDDFEGKYAWVNNSESFLLDDFLANIEIFKKSKVL